MFSGFTMAKCGVDANASDHSASSHYEEEVIEEPAREEVKKQPMQVEATLQELASPTETKRKTPLRTMIIKRNIETWEKRL